VTHLQNQGDFITRCSLCYSPDDQQAIAPTAQRSPVDTIALFHPCRKFRILMG